MTKQIIIAMALLVFTTMACNSQKETSSSNQAAKKERSGKQGPPSVDEVFKMDADNDGRLSRLEVTGRLLDDFSKFDTNGDGFITKTEFQNAPKPSRGKGGRPPRN